MKPVLNGQQMELTVRRLAQQVLERREGSEPLIVIGIQPRGILLSDRLVSELGKELGEEELQYGLLDITFYRDDTRHELHLPRGTRMPFSIEGKRVVLVDDVLFTGRTIRAALDALMDFGRPARVELLVLIDRRYSRQLPIQPDYTGRPIDSIVTQRVKVFWKEQDGKDEVVLTD